MKIRRLLLTPLLLLPLLDGCAYLTSNTTKTTDPATHVVMEKTRVRVYTLWDSTSGLSKFRNSTGGVGTNGFILTGGTTIGTLDQSSTSTNINELLGVIVQGAVMGAVKAAGKP
jgi:hypothetical protein